MLYGAAMLLLTSSSLTNIRNCYSLYMHLLTFDIQAFYKDEDIMPGIGQHARDLVIKLLHCNPLDRLGNVTDGAAAVMKHPFFGVLSSASTHMC
jgi:hypothetical protein